MDKLLTDRGMSADLRRSMLRQWKHKLMSKTDAEERRRKTEEGTWTAEDNHEWCRWKRAQKYAAVELPKEDGVEVFVIPDEWLEWDRAKLDETLQQWRVKGEVKKNVIRRWRAKKDRQAAGREEDEADKVHRRKGQTNRSEKRMQLELSKLMVFQRMERRQRDHPDTPQNGTEQHSRNGTVDNDNRKRQREGKEETEDEKQHEEPGSAVNARAKRQRREEKDEQLDSEPPASPPAARSAAELASVSKREEVRRKLLKVVQAEVLKKLVKRAKVDGRPRNSLSLTRRRSTRNTKRSGKRLSRSE